MDFNIVVLSGTLAVEPEHRTLPTGSSLLRLLVTVRSVRPRRRVDIVPVTLWDPPSALLDSQSLKGRRVFVAGAVQRRFWSVGGGKASRIEIVAHHVQLHGTEQSEGDEARASA